VGQRYVDYAGINGVVIDVAITPNRGDAAGVYGIARDLAAYGLGRLKDGSVPASALAGGKSPIGSSSTSRATPPARCSPAG
jgi:phenylalanyl-tRNA synthetase beta chain